MKESVAAVGRRVLSAEYLVLGLTAVYFTAVLPVTPGLATAENLTNILSSLMPLLILAVGQTIVLITGGIDLSVTSIVALASVSGAAVMSQETGLAPSALLAVPAGVACMILAGLLVGALNGTAIVRFQMPPFIVTLTSMMFFSGLAIWLTRSRNIPNLPPGFNAIGGQALTALLVTVLVSTAAQLALSRSLFGRWLYAVGHNAKAALISGVPVGRVTLWAYMLSGACAALAAVLYTGRLETGSPVLGQRLLLDVIGAAVIGGTSLYGGKGKVLWALYGALFLTVLDNSLNLLNLSYFAIMMVKGTVILCAAVLDTLRTRSLAGRASWA